MIAIIDYGIGNLRSVQKACEKIGFDAEIVREKQKIDNASHIILPGVGAFAEAMLLLEKTNLKQTLLEQVKLGKPTLGICLGMQIMFEKSYEDGIFEGLGIFEGEIRRFDCDLKIPHVGWNCLNLKKPSVLFEGIDDKNFYFTHSYHADKCNKKDILATCDYGYEFVVAASRDNLFGVQFHPEKSGDSGLKLLENFCKIK